MVKPGEAGSWYSSATPNPQTASPALPLGTLLLLTGTPGTGFLASGFEASADGSWGDWATYLSLTGGDIDCFLTAHAQASFNVPAGGLPWLEINHTAWIRSAQTQSANNSSSTLQMDVITEVPLYPFAADCELQVRVWSYNSTPPCPASRIEWLVTVWAPTPAGFVVPGS
jgi:hypothetical protein